MTYKAPLVELPVGHLSFARRIQLRHWSKQSFYDPCDTLNDLADFRLSPEFKQTSAHYRKRVNEVKQGALFAYLLGMLLDQDVDFCPLEESDHDCVLRTKFGEDGYFMPVQLKEIPPESLRKELDLYAEMHRALTNHGDLAGTTFAFFVNRHLPNTSFRIDLSRYPAEGIWVFGMLKSREAFLYGDLREKKRFAFRVRTELRPV